jgi:hypothetical protein
MPSLRRTFPLVLFLGLALALPACDSDNGDDDDLCNENEDCNSAFFCQFPADTCGSVGTCEIKPTDCPATIDPVCGCNDVTYTNECEAHRAGQSVDHDGPC